MITPPIAGQTKLNLAVLALNLCNLWKSVDLLWWKSVDLL